MFEETNLELNESAVDLIQSADVEVKTIAEVQKKIKSRQVNLATITTSLQGITTEDLSNVAPNVIKDFYAEANRIATEYKNIPLGI